MQKKYCNVRSWCGDSRLRGQGGARSWIISVVAACRFSPPILTSGLDSSAHMYVFNLRKFHLTSCIVHRVKEQWVSLYFLVPLWPSGAVQYGYDLCYAPSSPCVFVFSLLFCNYLTKQDYGILKGKKNTFPVDFPGQLMSIQWSCLPCNRHRLLEPCFQPMRFLFLFQRSP